MATELLALDEISSSQSQKEVTHNTALRQIEGRMVRALDKDLTTPPGSPSNGNTYIVPSGATGVWSGHTNKIAHYYGGAWTFWTPIEGIRLWLSDEDIEYAFDGSNWVVNAGAGLTPPFVDTTALVKGSTDATKKARLEVDGLTTGTTRTLTAQNRDYTIAGTDDVTVAVALAAADLATHAAAADPHTGYQKESEKAAANGYASLDSGGLVPAAQLPSASSLPVPDTTEIIKGSGDATKRIRFEVDGLTTATTRVLTAQNRDGTIALTAPRIATVTWASSMTVDFSDKDVAFVTLTGNTTFTLSGAVPGQKCLLVLKQDGTGSRTATFGSEVRFGTDITGITLTTTASKQDKIGFIFDDDGAGKYDVAAFVKGF